MIFRDWRSSWPLGSSQVFIEKEQECRETVESCWGSSFCLLLAPRSPVGMKPWHCLTFKLVVRITSAEQYLLISWNLSCASSLNVLAHKPAEVMLIYSMPEWAKWSLLPQVDTSIMCSTFYHYYSEMEVGVLKIQGGNCILEIKILTILIE